MTTGNRTFWRRQSNQKPEQKPDPAQLRRILADHHEAMRDTRENLVDFARIMVFDLGLRDVGYDDDGILIKERQPADARKQEHLTFGDKVLERAIEHTIGFLASANVLFFPQLAGPFVMVYGGVQMIRHGVQTAWIKRQLRKMGEDATIPQAGGE